MNIDIPFVAKTLALSILVCLGMLVVCTVSGLFLYIALDPHMRADSLSSFALFFFPFVFVGVPLVIAASRLVLHRRRVGLVSLFLGITFLFGTLGFAGFMVGAMGI